MTDQDIAQWSIVFSLCVYSIMGPERFLVIFNGLKAAIQRVGIVTVYVVLGMIFAYAILLFGL
jgi:type IV secretory pathway TrbD component